MGYSIEWREVNSRKFGKNRFPVRILFETQDDLLRFTGKQREFTYSHRCRDSAPGGISGTGKMDSDECTSIDRSSP